MRSFLAGLILFSALVLSSARSATGQVDGQVLGLGFNDNFRPDCWTPLKVQLKSHQNDAKSYMIQVHQQDLDKDTVVFTRVVPLGPNTTTDFWVYFVPQPTSGGLAGKPLGEVLKVYLYDETGKTLISPLPVNCLANDLDPPVGTIGTRSRGQKLILAVIGPGDNPAWNEYRGALGLTEGVEFVPVHVDDLPGSVLGLQAVDAIVWFDAEAREISSGGTGSFEAIQQYVKEGGQLVVCQPAERGKIAAFADAGMLPVETKDAKGVWLNDFKAEAKPDLQPLYDLAVNPGLQTQNTQRPGWSWTDRNWDAVRKSNKAFEMYRAKPKPDAAVDVEIHWGESKDGTPDDSPYIARRAYGMGSVAWVAQDLGSPALTSARVVNPRLTGGESRISLPTGGWPYVWDKVFGWNNRTIIGDDWNRDKDKIEHPDYRVDGAPTVELGASLASGMEASARGAWLVTVAIFFFIVYWIVAGPGSYLVLARRKQKGLSWTVFAAAALVATAVTVVVVKLVLRGDPEVHHITIVHLTPEAPAADGSPRFGAVASSRFGLYIPRDGEQTVELANASDKEPSYVIPLTVHPTELLNKDVGFTDTARYTVATDAFTSGGVSVGFPYRSTLKKIQTQWAGTVGEGITGVPQLIPPYSLPDPKDPKKQKMIQHGPLKGALNNGTGRDLHDIYIAYRLDWHERNSVPIDNLLYVRAWPNGGTIDLDAENIGAEIISAAFGHTPGEESTRSIKGIMSTESGGWYDYWMRGLSHASAMEQASENDSAKRYVRSLPLMAFIDRVAPFKGVKDEGDFYRADLLRHGGRGLNVSQLVASGRLVIVAEADGAVPFPLKVDGSPVGGEGVIFYEISLPLDDKLGQAATTRPAANPTTGPSAPAPGTVTGTAAGTPAG